MVEYIVALVMLGIVWLFFVGRALVKLKTSRILPPKSRPEKIYPSYVNDVSVSLDEMLKRVELQAEITWRRENGLPPIQPPVPAPTGAPIDLAIVCIDCGETYSMFRSVTVPVTSDIAERVRDTVSVALVGTGNEVSYNEFTNTLTYLTKQIHACQSVPRLPLSAPSTPYDKSTTPTRMRNNFETL